MSENCKSFILQDKCNIESFLSPGLGLSVALRTALETWSGVRKHLFWNQSYLFSAILLKKIKLSLMNSKFYLSLSDLVI